MTVSRSQPSSIEDQRDRRWIRNIVIVAVLVIAVSLLSIFYPIIRYGITGILLQ